MSRFTVEEIEQAPEWIDPVFLNSPQYECETLSKYLGAKLIVKIETLNPIRSFKGRGADLLVSKTKSDNLICASAGNFGQAMAYSCRKKGIALTVYASVKANPFKIERMRELGAKVILEGEDFDSAKIAAKQAAGKSGAQFVEDSLDVDTAIGAGTIGLELKNYHGSIDALLVPLGNGALINGIAKVMKTYRTSTRIIAIQAAGAPAMIESWKSGKVVASEKINTIADGIGVRIPVPQALDDMKGLVDEGLLVKEETIIEAMKLIHQHVGIIIEPSGAVGVAAMLENKSSYKNKTVAAVLCGSNLTKEQINNWIL
jgi:threonine dehydratase